MKDASGRGFEFVLSILPSTILSLVFDRLGTPKTSRKTKFTVVPSNNEASASLPIAKWIGIGVIEMPTVIAIL